MSQLLQTSFLHVHAMRISNASLSSAVSTSFRIFDLVKEIVFFFISITRAHVTPRHYICQHTIYPLHTYKITAFVLDNPCTCMTSALYIHFMHIYLNTNMKMWGKRKSQPRCIHTSTDKIERERERIRSSEEKTKVCACPYLGKEMWTFFGVNMIKNNARAVCGITHSCCVIKLVL